MRCIEMTAEEAVNDVETGLIETWDVLKFQPAKKLCRWCPRLIETWDVLKYEAEDGKPFVLVD